MKTSIYSYSRINTFQECPYKYKLKYIDNIESDFQSIEAFVGSCVHETLGKLYRDINHGKVNLLSELIQFYDYIWDKNWHENIKIVKKTYLQNHYKSMGKNYIANYYLKYKPFQDGKSIGIEKYIKVPIDEEGIYFIQGYIDRLVLKEGEKFEVHDYKTSNTLPTQEQIDNDWQLPIYQLAVENMWKDAKEVKLIWFFLAFDKKMESYRNKENLEELKLFLLQEIKKIEEETSFKPQEGNLCDWCEYPTLCPKRKEFFLVNTSLKKDSKENNEALVNEFISLKDKEAKIALEMKNLKDKIKKVEDKIIDYSCKNNVDVIKGENQYVKVVFEEKLEFPTKNEEGREELEKTIKELGKWYEVSNLNIINLAKKIINKEWEENITTQIEKYGEICKKAHLIISSNKKN